VFYVLSSFRWIKDDLFLFLKVMLTLSWIPLACCFTYREPYIFECKTLVHKFYVWVSYFRPWFLWPESKKLVIPFLRIYLIASLLFVHCVLLGNSGKPVTLETLSLTKFSKHVFQEQGIHDFRKPGTREASNSRMCKVRESWFGGEMESRTCGSPEPPAVNGANFGRRPIRESVEDPVRESRMMTFTNRRRSKVKVVVPKSPGLECELVADL
jgi:hypothetical protein